MRKKLWIMTLALVALLGLSTLHATAASGGENTVTLHVGTGQTFDTLDAALNYAAKTRSADPVEIILQSDTTMNTTARSLPGDITIKSEGDAPYTVTNTADFVVGSGQSLTLENVTFASSEGTAFQVNSGTLVTNDAVTFAGNRIVLNNSSYTMTDGISISGNGSIATEHGGGVDVINGGSLIMNGGEITGNSARYGGGVFVDVKSSFIMNGGTISGNRALSNTTVAPGSGYGDGGGVCNDGIFNMYGGNIINNTAATAGGGIYVGISGHFTIYGGTIADGNTARLGGGVFVWTNTSLTMTDGKITGNTATTSGGGIYLDTGSTFYLSGTPVVRDNTLTNGTISNFHSVTTATAVNVTAPLTEGADVWVTYPSTEGAVFATAASPEVAAVSARYFRNDLYSLTGTSTGNSLIWGRIAVELVQNGAVHSRYTSLSDALAVYTDHNTQMLLLAADIDTPATINKTIYLDLNGKSITGGLTVEDSCTLYGLDSATDAYTNDTYGRINVVSGEANIPLRTDTKAAHTTKEKYYLMVREDDGISFHRYNVQVSDYYFRLGFDENDPADTGSAMINFSSAVQGDSHVADAITKLELSSTPTSGTATTTSVSTLTDLKTTLSTGNPYYYRSHFIFPTNPYTEQYALKVSLSLTLSDGQTATLTSTKDRTLKDILGYFYKAAGTTEEQKVAIDAFLIKYNLGAIS